MSIGYYIFARNSKECISLGSKGRRNDHEYRGPIVILFGQRYLLPSEYLNLLIQRFVEKHGKNEVVVCQDYDLFDTDIYLKDDEDCLEIGGDRCFDPPITKYLPELEEEALKQEIQGRKDLRLGLI